MTEKERITEELRVLEKELRKQYRIRDAVKGKITRLQTQKIILAKSLVNIDKKSWK